MPYADVPAFMAALTLRRAHAAKALRFAILCAARTEEVTWATWDEFDLEAATWTRRKARMKAGVEHTVPLTPAALVILESLPRDKPPFALSENTMLFLMQRHMGIPFTVHSARFRSSFKDWCSEETDAPNEVSEAALAHVIRDKAEAAYRRGALLEKRRKLMEAWAAYLKV